MSRRSTFSISTAVALVAIAMSASGIVFLVASHNDFPKEPPQRLRPPANASPSTPKALGAFAPKKQLAFHRENVARISDGRWQLGSADELTMFSVEFDRPLKFSDLDDVLDEWMKPNTPFQHRAWGAVSFAMSRAGATVISSDEGPRPFNVAVDNGGFRFVVSVDKELSDGSSFVRLAFIQTKFAHLIAEDYELVESPFSEETQPDASQATSMTNDYHVGTTRG